MGKKLIGVRLQAIGRRGSMKNATSFKPGQSGNPKGGIKKHESITNIIKQYMDEKQKVSGAKKNISNKMLLVKKAFQLALKGDMTAIKFIVNYHDGMPPQKMDLTADENMIESIRISHEKRKAENKEGE